MARMSINRNVVAWVGVGILTVILITLIVLVVIDATNAPAGNPKFECTEATAPVHSDDPRYRSELDRDNDGIACESA